MRATQLEVGRRYAVRDTWAEKEAGGDYPLRNHRCFEVIAKSAPAPHADERLERITTRWHSPATMNAEDPEDRPAGILVRAVGDAGVVSGPPIWHDSARYFVTDWDTWSDRLSAHAARLLRHDLKDLEAPITVGYANRANCDGPRLHPFQPIGRVRTCTLVELDAPRGELEHLGRIPTNPDTTGAVVELGGTRMWIADRHHLCLDPAGWNTKFDDTTSSEARRRHLGRICEAQAMEMRLGRWAPSGNRYRDQPDWDERRDHYQTVPDASWLTYKPTTFGNGGTAEVGLETLVALLSLDDDTRSRFIEQISDVIAGNDTPETL